MSDDSKRESGWREAAPKTRSIYGYLRGIQPHYKARIGRVFRKRLSEAGVGRVSGGRFPCNRKTRAMLADSIFAVEDELESRCAGQPWHPDVLAMNYARNRVLTDLGWSEDSRGSCAGLPLGSRYLGEIALEWWAGKDPPDLPDWLRKQLVAQDEKLGHRRRSSAPIARTTVEVMPEQRLEKGCAA